MKKTIIYELDELEKQLLLKYIDNKISTREAGVLLKCSHQNAINRFSHILIHLYREGALKIDKRHAAYKNLFR